MYLEAELRSFGQMYSRQSLNRRCFLWSGLAFSNQLVSSARVNNETVYHFATRECDVRMTVEFYDRYTSKGFWFEERRTDKQFCLSADGKEGHNCVANFWGSIAVAHYRIRSRFHSPSRFAIRERVRTIDRDSRLGERRPYQRTLQLQAGVATDIQAFGYDSGSSDTGNTEPTQPHEPWCLFRQDLYLDGESAPFLLVHWKHTLSAIRILDLIPGDETQVVGNGKKEKSG